MSKKKTIKIEMSPIEAVVSVVLFLSIIGVWAYAPEKADTEQIEETSVLSSMGYSGPYEVVKVVDGDTIKISIDGETKTVRLIGVDTPESVHPNKEKNVPEGTLASDYTKSLVEDTYVYIEYGESPTDRYNRILAYVYMEDDSDSMLNAQLLEDGYAQVLTIKPNVKYEDYFLELESEAKNNNVGLWSTGVFDD